MRRFIDRLPGPENTGSVRAQDDDVGGLPREKLHSLEGTKLALGPRLLHEALVALPVVRALRVGFVGCAVFLQGTLGVVLLFKSVGKIVMGVVVVRVEA